jgi:citronellol/citronellal dehydrogenase
MIDIPFEPPDLTGKVAIVTGASRGIGKVVALRLAQCGCDVAVAARSEVSKPRLPGTIHDTVREIEALGRRAIAVKTNVREADEIEAMVERTVAELGRVDILINNAGALWWMPVAETPTKRFDLVMDVNARAAFVASRAVLPHMAKQGGGHILVYSPPLDMAMLPGKVAYCISKFGMTMLAQGLAEEVREAGIAANALWPATVVESQASINHGLGGPAMWRKAEIVADATLAILARGTEVTGRALLDEEILREAGVGEFDAYSCVPGGQPLYIVGEEARAALWSHRPPGS